MSVVSTPKIITYEDLKSGDFSIPEMLRLFDGELEAFNKKHGAKGTLHCSNMGSDPTAQYVQIEYIDYRTPDEEEKAGAFPLSYYLPLSREMLNRYNVPVLLNYAGAVGQRWRAMFGVVLNPEGLIRPAIDIQYRVYPELWVTGLGYFDPDKGMRKDPTAIPRINRMLNSEFPGWQSFPALTQAICEAALGEPPELPPMVI